MKTATKETAIWFVRSLDHSHYIAHEWTGNNWEVLPIKASTTADLHTLAAKYGKVAVIGHNNQTFRSACGNCPADRP